MLPKYRNVWVYYNKSVNNDPVWKLEENVVEDLANFVR